MRETVTSAGMLVVVALVLCIAAGLLFGWVEAWAVAAIALVLLIACIPFILSLIHI